MGKEGVSPACVPARHEGVREAGSCTASAPQAVNVRLDLFGVPFDTEVRVPRGRVRLADLVPVARQVCDRLVEFALARVEQAGVRVPCSAGCWACCRYMVPMSPPEAFRLLAEIHRLPPQRREAMLAAFRKAARQLRRPAEASLAAMAGAPSEGGVGDGALTAADRLYAGRSVDCPLLSGGLCSDYLQRPLACRCHFVLSHPRHCAEPSSGLRLSCAMPVSFVQALCRLSAELEGTELQAVLLPMAPDWAASQPARGRRTWPAPVLVRRFVGLLAEQVAQAAEARTA